MVEYEDYGHIDEIDMDALRNYDGDGFGNDYSPNVPDDFGNDDGGGGIQLPPMKIMIIVFISLILGSVFIIPLANETNEVNGELVEIVTAESIDISQILNLSEWIVMVGNSTATGNWSNSDNINDSDWNTNATANGYSNYSVDYGMIYITENGSWTVKYGWDEWLGYTTSGIKNGTYDTGWVNGSDIYDGNWDTFGYRASNYVGNTSVIDNTGDATLSFNQGTYNRTEYFLPYVFLSGGFDNGTYESKIFDGEGYVYDFLNITWVGNATLNLSVRTCDDILCDGESWIFIGNPGFNYNISEQNLYFQYRFDFGNYSWGGDILKSTKYYYRIYEFFNTTPSYLVNYSLNYTQPVDVNWTVKIANTSLSNDTGGAGFSGTWTNPDEYDFSDDFDRDDSFDLGPKWANTHSTDDGNVSIVNNLLRMPNSAYAQANTTLFDASIDGTEVIVEFNQNYGPAGYTAVYLYGENEKQLAFLYYDSGTNLIRLNNGGYIDLSSWSANASWSKFNITDINFTSKTYVVSNINGTLYDNNSNRWGFNDQTVTKITRMRIVAAGDPGVTYFDNVTINAPSNTITGEQAANDTDWLTKGHFVDGSFFINYTVANVLEAAWIVKSGYFNDSIYTEELITDNKTGFDRGDYNRTVNYGCFQTRANVSTACGGLDTGTYELYTVDSQEFIVDGDWETLGYVTNILALLANYTIPLNIQTAMLSYRKAGGGQFVNVSIPESCLNYSSTLAFRFYRPGAAYINISCFTGPDTNITFNQSQDNGLFEIAVTWGNDTVVLQSILFNGSTRITLDNGTYESEIFSGYSWHNLTWGGNDTLNLSTRGCDDAVCDGEAWTLRGNGTFNYNITDTEPYFQYRFDFGTGDVLYNVTMNYENQYDNNTNQTYNLTVPTACLENKMFSASSNTFSCYNSSGWQTLSSGLTLNRIFESVFEATTIDTINTVNLSVPNDCWNGTDNLELNISYNGSGLNMYCEDTNLINYYDGYKLVYEEEPTIGYVSMTPYNATSSWYSPYDCLTGTDAKTYFMNSTGINFDQWGKHVSNDFELSCDGTNMANITAKYIYMEELQLYGINVSNETIDNNFTVLNTLNEWQLQESACINANYSLLNDPASGINYTVNDDYLWNISTAILTLNLSTGYNQTPLAFSYNTCNDEWVSENWIQEVINIIPGFFAITIFIISSIIIFYVMKRSRRPEENYEEGLMY